MGKSHTKLSGFQGQVPYMPASGNNDAGLVTGTNSNHLLVVPLRHEACCLPRFGCSLINPATVAAPSLNQAWPLPVGGLPATGQLQPQGNGNPRTASICVSAARRATFLAPSTKSQTQAHKASPKPKFMHTWHPKSSHTQHPESQAHTQPPQIPSAHICNIPQIHMCMCTDTHNARNLFYS